LRSNKHYTNVAFTKRVDYPAGAHRPARAWRGTAVCPACGAVYVRRRWIAASDPRAATIGAGAAARTCPACDKAAKHQVGGYLTLQGAFAKEHRPEIEQLLKREAARALEDNPVARVIGEERTPDVLTVLTSTEHLAQRLGAAVHGAYAGKIDYNFSHGEKFGRVVWRRD